MSPGRSKLIYIKSLSSKRKGAIIHEHFDYGVFDIYHSRVMALFLLETMDFLGFQMIFKVLLNHIFLNLNTMLYAIL
jgi:hypothetical protein